jgi:hypothetical protein
MHCGFIVGDWLVFSVGCLSPTSVANATNFEGRTLEAEQGGNTCKEIC